MHCLNSTLGRKMRFIAGGCDQWRVSKTVAYGSLEREKRLICCRAPMLYSTNVLQ